MTWPSPTCASWRVRQSLRIPAANYPIPSILPSCSRDARRWPISRLPAGVARYSDCSYREGTEPPGRERRVKILIADDDPLSLRLLQLTLERFGHEVEAVNNGVDAEESLLRPTGPRLAILDWMMPRADGLSVCRAVRRHIDRYVYLIVLTSLDRREDMLAALDAGVDDFLTKPFNTDELRARLRSGERVLALEERLLAVQTSLQFHATHDYLTGVLNRAAILDRLTRRTDACAPRRHARLGDARGSRPLQADQRHAGARRRRHHARARRQAPAERHPRVRHDRPVRWGRVSTGVCPDAIRKRRSPCRSAPVLRLPSRSQAAGAPPVSVSIGVACTIEAGQDPQALVIAADQALYRAKASGRNCVAAWSPRALRPFGPSPSP